MMNLDRHIESMTSKALKMGTLDVTEDMKLSYGDVYSAMEEEITRLRGIEAAGGIRPYALAYGTIVNVRDLLEFEGEEFVENAYLWILGRPADKGGLAVQLQALNAGTADKESILWNIGTSEEAKQNGILLTGFQHMDVSVFGEYQDKEFVEMAYVHILGRHADATGIENFLYPMMNGLRSKEEILYMILHSAEGELRGLEIRGLDALYQKRCRRNRIYRVPVVGRCIRFVQTICGLNRRLSILAVREYQAECEIQRMQEKETADMALLEETKAYARSLEERINQIGGHLNQVGRYLNEVVWKLENRAETMGQELQVLQESFDGLRGEMLSLRESEQEAIAGLRGTLEELQKEVAYHGSELGQMINDTQGVYSSLDYFEFENHFRGSREHVKNVQTMYLPYYAGKKKVLDLGCGRGEFTEMLAEQNVGVIGVDQYAPYVDYVKSLGLPAVHDDALHYLGEQESVDGIFLGQVVEHISVGKIMDICKLAYQKLEPGCYLIMETPNPTALGIYTSSFYIDPSHRKPIHPLTLQYLARKAGFSSVEILYTQPSRMPFSIPPVKEEDADFKEFNEAMGRVSEMLYGSRDYAIVARK